MNAVSHVNQSPALSADKFGSDRLLGTNKQSFSEFPETPRALTQHSACVQTLFRLQTVTSPRKAHALQHIKAKESN